MKRVLVFVEMLMLIITLRIILSSNKIGERDGELAFLKFELNEKNTTQIAFLRIEK